MEEGEDGGEEDLLDQPEGRVWEEDGEREEDEAGDDHDPREGPEGQLATHQDTV